MLPHIKALFFSFANNSQHDNEWVRHNNANKQIYTVCVSFMTRDMDHHRRESYNSYRCSFCGHLHFHHSLPFLKPNGISFDFNQGTHLIIIFCVKYITLKLKMFLGGNLKEMNHGIDNDDNDNGTLIINWINMWNKMSIKQLSKGHT